MNSRRSGRHDVSYTQYKTIRKLRSSYSSHVRAVPQTNVNQLSLVDQKGQYVRLTMDKCGSLWFVRYMVGLKSRMGNVWKPNKGLLHKLLLLMIHKAKQRITEAEVWEGRHKWTIFTSYIVLTDVVALRGNESLMLELSGLNEQLKVERSDICMIVLYGKLKGEEQCREHQIPCVNKTRSGLNIKYTIYRLVQMKKGLGLTSRPVISDSKTFLLPASDLDTMVHELLIELYEIDNSIFPPTVTATEGIIQSYRVNRTLCRTANTRALDENVDSEDINLLSKWKQKDATGKRIRSQPMKHNYAQFDLLLQPFEGYTYQM